MYLDYIVKGILKIQIHMQSMEDIKNFIKQERQSMGSIDRSVSSIAATVDMNALLAASENVDMDFLGNSSLADIAKEIHDVLQFQEFADDFLEKCCMKLVEYRYVDKIYQLHKGKHVRWIRIGQDAPSLTNGGIVTDIKFLDNGTHILCKNGPRFIQYRWDDCLTFQKLSADEQLVLGCMELVRKK